MMSVIISHGKGSISFQETEEKELVLFRKLPEQASQIRFPRTQLVITAIYIGPGPGLYEKPTEFGVYGDTKYYKTLSGFHKAN
jgi:hypothetical protein